MLVIFLKKREHSVIAAWNGIYQTGLYHLIAPNTCGLTFSLTHFQDQLNSGSLVFAATKIYLKKNEAGRDFKYNRKTCFILLHCYIQKPATV